MVCSEIHRHKLGILCNSDTVHGLNLSYLYFLINFRDIADFMLYLSSGNMFLGFLTPCRLLTITTCLPNRFQELN